jgi:hypothetical protein
MGANQITSKFVGRISAKVDRRKQTAAAAQQAASLSTQQGQREIASAAHTSERLETPLDK